MKHKMRLEDGSEVIPVALTETEITQIIDALEAECECHSSELEQAQDDPEYQDAILEEFVKTRTLLEKMNQIHMEHGFGCVDCSVNTSYIEEYYMVQDHVWSQSGLEKDDGMLCIRCLETRIGRKLTPSDFIDAAINTLDYPASDTKKNRLRHTA